MRSRTLSSLFSVVVIGAFALGCGHSEEEWQAKLRENKDLSEKLNAESAARKKCDDDLKDAQANAQQLELRLKKLGVDLSNKDATLAEQASALEKLRREKEQLDEIRKRFDALKQKLDALTKLGLSVTVRKNKMTIQLPGDVLFDSGKVDLKSDGKDILAKVAEVVRNDPQLVSRTFQVAGHTDNQPLSGGPYKDNWGLSAMRAREVVNYLVGPRDAKTQGGGLPPDHWSAAGYGDTDPIAANDTPDNMKKNRRVELVVLPNVEEMLDLKSLTK